MKFVTTPEEKVLADKCDILAIGCVQSKLKGKTIPSFGQLLKISDEKLSGELMKQTRVEKFTAKKSTSMTLFSAGLVAPRYIMLYGLGERQEISLDDIRNFASAATRSTEKIHGKKCAVVLPKLPSSIELPDAARAIAEGTMLGSYAYENYKSDEDDKHERVTEVSIAIDRPSEKFKKALDFGAALAEATVRARDMINTPANYMTPSHLIVEAKRIAKTAGLSCTVYDKKRMADEKMECILSVAKGSEEPPALIVLEYCPKKKPKKHVVLVGKGVTFDAGGISLKPPQGMPTMKDDMAGAAAVIAAMSTIGNFKPGIKVTAIIPAVENLPDGKALKPGDIIRAKNGKTIEIITTDAEGRLILADALVLASEMKPSAIVDLATLTGGALYCCGELYSLIMGNDERLIAKMMAAAKSSGEPMWQLPMVEEYKKGYTSGIADLKNSGKSKAQTIMGAIFLREFVDEKIPWAHIDIAASSWTEEKLPLSDLGGTGAMTRSLIEFVMKF